MSDLLKVLFGEPGYVFRTDTAPDSPDPDPNDVWAFTDPDAKDTYARQGQLRELEHDVRFEVMRGQPWLPEELEYKLEIRRLLRAGFIADKGTYWFRSPHPTVYRAHRNGALTVAGRTYRFRAGDDIVFQCRMERDAAGDEPGPVLIARLQTTEDAVLCGEMSGAMKGMGRRM
ncbi:MAG TPA: hypothetical protein VJL59_23990 [Anaerolineales bacterium]|nr:hypothetical protein [Anaerolineales bacterium]